MAVVSARDEVLLVPAGVHEGGRGMVRTAMALVRHRAIQPSVPLRVIQGQAHGRPGEVRVVVDGQPSKPRKAVAGGHAVVSLRGYICLEGG